MTQDLEGAKLGQYELQEMIGQGRITTTYRAYQPRARRTVAVKVFPGELLEEEGFWVQFKREASVLARLKHQNILPIYDVDHKGDVPYVVYRYLPVDSLADWLRKGALLLQQAVHIAEQIASALDNAHQHGIIHHAIKPSNILIDANEYAYLFDFEIPCIRDVVIRLTGVSPAGAPAYMAPELGAGAPATVSADIYALGIVFFEMVTGQLPFDADTPIDMMIEHRVTPVPPIRPLNPEVPIKMSAAITQALAKIPEDRFEAAGSFATVLRDSIKRSTNGLKFPLWSYLRDEKRWWIFVLIALVISIAALALGVAAGAILRRW